jgi:CBS domain-containing protein
MVKIQPIPIREVMSRELLIVRKDEKLDRVEEIFQAYNIHHLPVVDEAGQLCGIISRYDQIRSAQYSQSALKECCAEDIMTTQVATIGPNDPLHKAAEIFLSNVFHALPVVDRSQLIGMLTTHDILRFCFNDDLLLEND